MYSLIPDSVVCVSLKAYLISGQQLEISFSFYDKTYLHAVAIDITMLSGIELYVIFENVIANAAEHCQRC